MKFIIEPSIDKQGEMPFPYHRVELEHPWDDLTLDDVVRMLDHALKAWGYRYDGNLTIKEPERNETET